ncbi:MAG: transaldolase [Actinomycetota bacterium]|nr:transaldolase [Actinomycetota bacterium]
MTKLHDLFERHGQSPWLDNLRRDWLVDGELGRWVERGVRGITSNPSTFQKAMSEGSAYDEQLDRLLAEGGTVPDAYWAMVTTDIEDTLALLRPVYDESGGQDGYVSLELGPAMARDTHASIAAARGFHEAIDEPNLMIKIPATDEGVPAVQRMIAEGRSINITLIFSLDRYAEVIEAYISGLEELAVAQPDRDLRDVASVASFFISRVDVEIDKRLEAIGTEEARALKGKAAVAQAKLAYRLFGSSFAGDRWKALVERGARVQRPLWASTSTKDPSLPDTLYVDTLIGPDTVNTMPEGTIEAFEAHGTVAATVDQGAEEAEQLFEQLTSLGVDLDDVSVVLEEEGVQAFVKAFDGLLATLEEKVAART